MHKVISATTNLAKIQTILRAFEEIFGEGSCHIKPIAVESGVPERPFGNQETHADTRDRVVNAHRLHPQADFWVATEAGINDDATFGQVVIDGGIQRGETHSAALPLPTVILDRAHKGEALGPAMSDYTDIDEVGCKKGAIGVFIAGKLTHSSVYHQAVILALSPFHNAIHDESLWFVGSINVVPSGKQRAPLPDGSFVLSGLREDQTLFSNTHSSH